MAEIEYYKIFTGKRTNRYLDAPIAYEQYPSDIEFASKGKSQYDCCSIKDIFTTKTKKEFKLVVKDCGKLDCKVCGPLVASKRAKRSALRILASIKLTDWIQINFASLNYTQESHPMKENETGKEYKLRIEKEIAKDIMECGIEGFALIYHSCRIKQINGIEMRTWSGHFHMIYYGIMPHFDVFAEKFGYTYSVPKKDSSIDIYNKEQLAHLVPRISYRLNHCAIFRSKSGQSLHTIKYYGQMSYRKLQKIDEIKKTETMTDSEGNPFVKIEVSAEKIKSSKNMLLFQKLLALKREKLNLELDNIGKTFYYPMGFLAEIERLESMRFNKDVEISKDIEFNPYINESNELTYLVEVEHIITFKKIDTGQVITVSSYELEKDKTPSIIQVSEARSRRIHQRAREIKKARKKSLDQYNQKNFEYSEIFK